MRGKILLTALEILKETAISQIDFFAAVLNAGYGASMGKLDYEYEKIQRAREQAEATERELQRRKRRLQVFISQMKHDGLISNYQGKIKISKKGKQKLRELKNKLPARYYPKEKQNHLTIISFDIPEKLRPKRNWLREVIRNLGFQMIHQSVWVGKMKIPETLILDLEEMKILEYIEMFEITKTGSLKKVE